MADYTKRKSMTILTLTKYSYEGPSSRYRFYNYKECFKKDGIYMIIKPLFNSSYFKASNKIKKISIVSIVYIFRFLTILKLLTFEKKRYDLVLIEYEVFPYFPAVFEYLLKKRGIRYIVDYDDAIFHRYDLHDNFFIRAILKNKIAHVMRYADFVIVCNEYLRSYANNYSQNIYMIPTVVLLDRYKQKMKTLSKKDSKTFTIGWIGSRTTSVYVVDILPVFERFVKKYKNVQFNLVGFDKTLLSQDELEKYHINTISWKEEKEIEEILSFDVGIMPLRDNAWSKGKCGFKLIQYMSCAKPVIASPVGINTKIVKDSINGFLVSSIDEWFEAFEKLYLNEKLRVSMGKSGFEIVKSDFSYERNCKRYTQLFYTVIYD